MPMKIRKNDIRTVDSLYLPFTVSEDTSMTFWDVESTKLTYYPNRQNQENADVVVVGMIPMETAESYILHQRIVYNL